MGRRRRDGAEDYANEAWGLRVSGGLWRGNAGGGIEYAGWTYNADGSLGSGTEERPDYFPSAAFCYRKDVNEGLPEPPYGAVAFRWATPIISPWRTHSRRSPP